MWETVAKEKYLQSSLITKHRRYRSMSL